MGLPGAASFIHDPRFGLGTPGARKHVILKQGMPGAAASIHDPRLGLATPRARKNVISSQGLPGEIVVRS